MRRNPFAKLMKKDPLKQSLEEWSQSVEEALRMEQEGLGPALPTHLTEGMYKDVAVWDVPTWFLESLTDKAQLPDGLEESVCAEILRRQLGVESVLLEDTLKEALRHIKQVQARQNISNKTN